VKLAVPVLAAAFLYGCGYVGPPQPPTLDIPATIADFRAGEYGDNIEVAFTMPATTTEALPLENVRSVELRIRENGAQEKIVVLPVTIPGPATERCPSARLIGKSITLLRVTGLRGKLGLVESASLIVIPRCRRLRRLSRRTSRRCSELQLTGSGPRYRIFRAEADGQPAPPTDTNARHI
jgi:hypothetical protein